MIDLLGMGDDPLRLIDTMPLPLMSMWTVKKGTFRRWFVEQGGGPDGHMVYPSQIGEADLGYCASKKLCYFGMKLHVCTTTAALPTHWLLIPASWHDITVLQDMVASDPWLPTLEHLIADKAYLDADLAHWICQQYHVSAKASPKKNSKPK